jgi:hypothetical protein
MHYMWSMRQQYFESMKTFGSPEKNMKITFYTTCLIMCFTHLMTNIVVQQRNNTVQQPKLQLSVSSIVTRKKEKCCIW